MKSSGVLIASSSPSPTKAWAFEMSPTARAMRSPVWLRSWKEKDWCSTASKYWLRRSKATRWLSHTPK